MYPSFTLVMANIKTRLISRVSPSIIQSAVNDVLDSGLYSSLEKPDAPICLRLLAECEAIGIDEDAISVFGSVFESSQVIPKADIAFDAFDVAKTDEVLAVLRLGISSHQKDAVLARRSKEAYDCTSLGTGAPHHDDGLHDVAVLGL